MAEMPKFYVEPPVTKPLQFGLLSVADVRTMPDGHWAAGIEWETEYCGVTEVATQPCVDDFETPKTPFNPEGTTEADAFTVYAMAECRATGDWARGSTHATNALTRGEDRGVEQGVWQRMMADDNLVVLSGTYTPLSGLARLEDAIANVYPGQATIHMPRNLASVLGTQQVGRHGTHLETNLGSLVAAGAGYSIDTGPDNAASTAGSSWMIATGSVLILRGNAMVKGPFMVQEPRDNTYVALAERTYVAGWECAVLAVKVTDSP